MYLFGYDVKYEHVSEIGANDRGQVYNHTLIMINSPIMSRPVCIEFPDV